MKTSHFFGSKSISTLVLALLLGACGGDSPESLIASSKDYLAKSDSKAAVIQLKNALQQNPNLAEARFLLGKALLDGGDITGAEVELRKALELKYSPDAVVPLLANVMLAKGQAKKLIEDFGKTTLSATESTAALNTSLSAAHASLGRLEVAKQLLEAALAAQPDYAPAQLAEIRQKIASRDLAGARSKIEVLLSRHPNNPDGLLLNGGMLASEGDLEGALAQYQKAIDAKPTYIPAYASAISLLIKTNKPEEAKKYLEALKKVAPKNAQSYFLDAQLNYRLKDFKLARESAQQLLRIAPNNPEGLQIAGAIEYQLRSYLQAETYLAKALQSAPQLPLARRLLVASQLRAGNAAKAIETLQPAMERIDQDPALLSLAGEAYLQHGEPNKAAEYFAKASKLEPDSVAKRTSLALAHIAQGSADSAYQELERISLSDKGVVADLALIAAYLQSNQVEKALKAIDGLEKKQPDNPASHNLRARALLVKKDLHGARNSFEKALAINPTFFPAVSGLASLDFLDKKPELARKRFETLLSVDPRNTQALLAIAELRATERAPSEEVASLIGKAVSANPTETMPRLALIQHLLKNKDYKKALSAATEANTVIPDKPEILDALGRTQQLSGELNQASITYGKLASLQPASPLPLLRLAETQFANKNPEDGTKTLKKALELKPDLLEAQRALVQLAMDNKTPRIALDIAKTVQTQRPKEAVGYLLEGNIHASEKAWSEAINAFRRGLKQTESAELAIKLHGAYLASGNSGEADKHSNSWLKDHPKDIAFRMYLGDLSAARKDYSLAVSHYQAALIHQPNHPLVLNNLAWISGKTGSPKAIEYAQKANQLAPNQPAFMDTLAMLLAEKGESEKAIELLRKAMAISPQAASIQMNLAKVLIAVGKKDDARKELEAVAKLGEKFPAQPEVSQLLKSL